MELGIGPEAVLNDVLACVIVAAVEALVATRVIGMVLVAEVTTVDPASFKDLISTCLIDLRVEGFGYGVTLLF